MCFQIYVQIQEKADEMSEGATSLSLKEKKSSARLFLGGKVSLYE